MKHIQLQKQNVFIMTDIHGCYEELEAMLQVVPAHTKILFLGDFVDRGANSLKAVRIVKQLVESGRAYAIRGNHEEMLLKSIDGEMDEAIYLRNGGEKTFQDFAAPVVENVDTLQLADYVAIMNKHYTNEIDFIRALPLYIDMHDYLFVHAGVDPQTQTLTSLRKKDILWIREAFHYTPHALPHKIFFGHTPVQRLEGGTLNGIWYNDAKTKFDLDGGCVFGGWLNGVLLNVATNTLHIYEAKKSATDVSVTLVKTLSL